MPKSENKKKYVKRSVYDRMIYYASKAADPKATKYDQDFLCGFMDGVDGTTTKNKRLNKTLGYGRGLMRGSQVRDESRNVKF